MVGASKILTVSYGTFSCTLEGFDEPFNTMKAIAEYFRDLAADDRYFGAEPPQPDAEMLHRIAEREIQRRVEAKIQRNGVILRQAEETAPAPAEIRAPGPAPTAAPSPEVSAPVAEEPVVAAPAAEAPEPVLSEPEAPVAPEPVPFVVPQSADPVSESVAAKLQRIRAAVASAKAAAAATPAAAPIEEAVEAPAEAPVAVSESMPEAEPVAEIAEETVAEEPVAEAPAAFEEPLASDIEEIAPTAEAPVEEPAEPEPAIEALVAAETVVEEPVVEEADFAAMFLPEASVELPEADQPETEAETPAEPSAAVAQTAPEAVAEAQTPEAAPQSGWAERRAARRAARHAAEETEASVTAEEAAAPAPEVEAPRPPLRARVIKVRRIEPAPAAAAPVETPLAAPVAEAAATDATPAEEDVAALVAARLAAETAPAAEDGPALTPEQEAELMAELAALEEDFDEDEGEALTGADTDAALAAAAEDWDFPEAFEALREEPAEEPTADARAAEALAPEEMAEDTIAAALAAHLGETAPAPEEAPLPEVALAPEAEAPAGIEPEEMAAQIAAMLPDEAAEAAAVEPAAPVIPRRIAQKPAAASRDDDVTRLMEEADAQLSGHENRRRLSAIAHLKAAVAATVAERLARGGRKEEAADETRPYRDDLTHAVRPRRPVLHGVASARPEPVEPRQAPLVLVSEQRVDQIQTAPAVQPAMPVRPRRVSTAQLLAEDVVAPQGGAESFADFAQARGTQGLSDLLEAAAAYTAQVEGRPHFSPPQIMSKVTAIGEGSFSREDRLRSFGQLLRQGKIAKVKRGQYAITEQSQYFEKRA